MAIYSQNSASKTYNVADVTCHSSDTSKVSKISKNDLVVGKFMSPVSAYNNSSADELSLSVNSDVVTFTEEEGWFYGYSPAQSKSGYFPANFVKASPSGSSPPIREEQSSASLPPPQPRRTPPRLPSKRTSLPGNSSKPSVVPPVQPKSQQAYSPMKAEKNPMAPKSPQVSTATASTTTLPAVAPRGNPSSGNRFKGRFSLQFLLWAHNMARASAVWLFPFGIFTVMWAKPAMYDCTVGGEPINDIYLGQTSINSSVVCDPGQEAPDLNGDETTGYLAIICALLILLFENESLGFGLYFPSDTFSFEKRVSFRGVVYGFSSIPFYRKFPVALAAPCLSATALCNIYGVWRGESGDGGRARAAAAKKRAADNKARNPGKSAAGKSTEAWNFDPIKFYTKLVDENKLSAFLWLFAYFVANVFTFFVTLDKWKGIVNDGNKALVDGTLDTTCEFDECLFNQVVVQRGGISAYGPYAKACGMCLNFNCSLIIYPIVRHLLRRLNNIGGGVSLSNNPSVFAKFFAKPITKYIPLSKNIEFHKIIAKTMCGFAVSHTLFHFLNYWQASEVTLARFFKWGYGGTAFVTGSIICLAMFMIFTAAGDNVRHAHYEIFFSAHHWFVLFFIVLLLHGPVFWKWSAVPLSLYLWERIMQQRRGDRPFLVNKVEWIEPVMAIQFRPIFKSDFEFKEGQYLYLNCPYINPNEWHPFTISSASGDLAHGPRVSIETGEEVMEVPRPAGLSKEEKWSKYCPVNKDYKKMRKCDYLEKHETGYNDFVSCHVKVHGLEDKYARSWTRKLKEYFELMNPTGKFPFYFNQRDERGDLHVGRRYGPDGFNQILRVDGPHSAPSEHYGSYGTVMLIGAGIGLTPCASILTALLRYRWKKNFFPEILHFYWMVRQSDIDSFQWLVHLLTDLSHETKHAREQNQIGSQYYVEINIYITGCAKEPVEETQLKIAEKENFNFTKPTFRANHLHKLMLNPKVKSKDQVGIQNSENSAKASNRLQDIWVWEGRPAWDKIFAQNKSQRQHDSIGVCFCGAAVIGKDLQRQCQKHSSVEEDIQFQLHKENF